MHRRGYRTTAAIAAAMALSGCVTGLKERPALRVPVADFRQRVATLCLVPARSQIEFPNQAEKLAAIERDIGDRLRAAGYTVVGSSETGALVKQVATEQGGYYDPHTGERDPLRSEAVQGRIMATLHERLGCDATVAATIAVVSVPFSSGRASWDGVSYSYGFTEMGWTTGLSLWLSIRSIDDQELYFSTGGIETVVDLDLGFFKNEFTPVTNDKILADQVRIVQAINVCLQPLLDPAPSGG